MAVDVIRGAVFDFGGVLTRSDVSDAQLRAYNALLGLPADSLRNLLYSGEAWELASTGQLSVEDYWERVGKPYEAQLPADFAAFRRGVFHAEPINEAVVRIATQLRRRLSLAICSNALMDLADVLAAGAAVSADPWPGLGDGLHVLPVEKDRPAGGCSGAVLKPCHR